jgi:hypothetical protein
LTKKLLSVAAAFTEVESAITGAVEAQPGMSRSLSLGLEVSDPEVVFELRKRRAGEERDEFLIALRIGVILLRAAAGQIDAAGVK